MKETIILYAPEQVWGNIDCSKEDLFKHIIAQSDNDDRIERYTIETFIEAFNNEAISDQGMAVIVQPEVSNEEKIIVEVRGGIAYCDDPRVFITDYDNKDEEEPK